MMNRREFLASAVALPVAGTAGPTLFGGTLPIALEHLGASTACLAGYPLLRALETLELLGFSTVEMITYTGASHSVGLIPGFDFRAASARERELVYEATRRFRYTSGHLPFDGLQLFSSGAEARQASLDTLTGALDGLAYLKGEVAVMHAGWPEQGSSYRDIWPRMVEILTRLGDFAGERGLTIGLETMQPDSVAEYVQLITDINHPRVGATIDTGHIRGARDITVPPDLRDSAEGRQQFNDVLNRLVHELGEHVVHVHLSDVQSRDWRDHRALGTGIVDFPRFFRSLAEESFDGLLVLELEEPNTLAALRSSRSLVEKLIGS